MRIPAALLLAAGVLASCSMEPDIDSARTDIRGDDFRVIHLGPAGSSSLDISLNVGSSPSDVFVVYTNPASASLNTPVLRTSTGDTSGSVLRTSQLDGTQSTTGTLDRSDFSPNADTLQPRSLTGELREYYSHLQPSSSADSGSEDSGDLLMSSDLRLSGDGGYALNQREELYGLTSTNPTTFSSVPACAAHVIDPGTHDPGLVVWVQTEDLSDDSCSNYTHASPAQARELAAAFMDDTNPDLYRAVTDIYGRPWGEHSYDNLIRPWGESYDNLIPAQQDYVHIFLFDIAPNETTDGSFIAGYFNPADVYLQSEADKSNERLIFYLHGPAYIKEDTDDSITGWRITDSLPSFMVQTAAHEFQHVVNFYQKSVRQSAGQTDVWLDELMSLMAEDYTGALLKARYSGEAGDDDQSFIGPRGTSPLETGFVETDAANIIADDGRLPLFNYWNMRGVTSWGDDGQVLPDYSASYAFGAWLARNYGGAEFMKSVLANRYTGPEAVAEAVDRHGRGNLRFDELLERWGASVILSDRLVPVSGYRYQALDGFSSSSGGTDVTLGSINLFNYEYSNSDGVELTGPHLYTSDNTAADEFSGHLPYSNLYYAGPQGVTEDVDLTMTQSPETRVTIVVRERR